MRLEFDARARRILRMIPRSSVYTALELTLLAAVAVQGARLVWTVVTPVGPIGTWRVASPGASIGAAEMLRGFDPFFRLEAKADTGPAVVTPLALTLFGTRTNDATGRGSAIIATPDGEQNSYAVGAEIMPGVTLKSVAFDHVTLTRGGVDEDLFIDQSGSGAAGAAPAAPTGTDSSLASPNAPGNGSSGAQGISLARLRAEIGFIPRIDGGKVTGLVVRPQGSGGAFRQIGFKEGDIVTQIGGRPVSGQGDIEALAGQFAKGGNLAITVERGAEVLPLTVGIVGQ